MSMPAWGLRSSRRAMSWRSTSMHTRLFERDRVGLVRRLLEHRGEAEEFAVRRLVDDDLLMILVEDGDTDFAGNHDVGAAAVVADFVDALARRETS